MKRKRKSTSNRRCKKSGMVAILRDGVRPGEEGPELFHCRRFPKFGKFLQQKQQVAEGIKAVSLRRFDHTEAQRACVCALRSIAKQEVPSGHNERLSLCFGSKFGISQKNGIFLFFWIFFWIVAMLYPSLLFGKKSSWNAALLILFHTKR